jgi:UDP-N-acetylmuramoyl-tripeptide--D-alanyl-D-alanine ligase
MIAMTLAEIAAATGGALSDAPDPDAAVTGTAVCDSRQAAPGSLFAAITGKQVDGHDFAAQALAAGASCVLASRPVGGPAVIVPEVTAALGVLAAHIVRLIPDAIVIGLTGSAGKTTTKDLLAHTLTRHAPTVATPESFNTEIGMPLTVLRAGRDTRYIVLEMGARHAGDIAYLTSLVQPRVGLVLNVGSAHLGEFGSREAIGRAKSELVQALPDARSGGVAVLNADDTIVAAMARSTRAAVITYGTGNADVRATQITTLAGRAAFTLVTPSGTAAVRLRLLGLHQVHNALAVAATACALGLDASVIAEALSTADASRSRLEIIEMPGGVSVINDAFNANPESMQAGLRAFAEWSQGRRTIAVLGEMRELGPLAEEAHRAVGRIAAELGITVLVTIGAGPVDALARAAADGPSVPLIRNVASTGDLDAKLAQLIEPGDAVFIKASRSIGLENFRPALA